MRMLGTANTVEASYHMIQEVVPDAASARRLAE